MTEAERVAFLEGLHVGVVSIDEPGRGPLTAPVWYAYQDGQVLFVTGRNSRKGKLLADGTRVSLCAQQESLPYRYVTVEGPVTLERPDYERHIKAIAYRYLGQAGGDQYLSMGGERNLDNEVLVRLTPERWLTVDYGKM